MTAETSASTSTSAELTSPSLPRRAPTQRRSRERVERMLAAARDLIAERGSDEVKMSDVAERAGVSIGSLYQFFPDKTAIIRTLAERINDVGRACIAEGLAVVRTPETLTPALSMLIDEYYAMFLADPVMRDIWSGTQAAKDLQEVTAAEGERLTRIFLDAILPFHPAATHAELAVTVRLMVELTDATMRLAISVDRADGDALVAAFKHIFIRELTPA